MLGREVRAFASIVDATIVKVHRHGQGAKGGKRGTARTIGAAKIFPGEFHVSRSALSFLARQLVAASEGIFRFVGPKAKTPHREGASGLMIVGCARAAIGRRRQR